MTTVWAAGHVVVGLLLASAGTAHDHAAPQTKWLASTRPDIDPHTDEGNRACLCTDRTTL
ncbi:hypothetical protein [Streptomyces lavendulae]|uniref:hypothetical protein n=1 Tax=Streptomyces lavendulae TaxID=1914 RepID=UPI0036EE50A2